MKTITRQTTMAAALLLCLSSGAHAAPAAGWNTGWYIGATAAYSNSNIDGEIGGPTPGGTFTDSADANGGDFGLVYGLRYDLGNNWFIGGEGDFAWSTASENGNIAGVLPVKVSKNYSYGFYAKPGYQASDKVALFGTLGWKWSEYELEVVGVGSDKDTFNGFTYGGGIEYSFTQNIRASLEYNRTDYANKTYQYGGGDYSKFGGDENVIKTAIKYYF